MQIDFMDIEGIDEKRIIQILLQNIEQTSRIDGLEKQIKDCDSKFAQLRQKFEAAVNQVHDTGKILRRQESRIEDLQLTNRNLKRQLQKILKPAKKGIG